MQTFGLSAGSSGASMFALRLKVPWLVPDSVEELLPRNRLSVQRVRDSGNPIGREELTELDYLKLSIGVVEAGSGIAVVGGWRCGLYG
jgi:hypothetical protein